MAINWTDEDTRRKPDFEAGDAIELVHTDGLFASTRARLSGGPKQARRVYQDGGSWYVDVDGDGGETGGGYAVRWRKVGDGIKDFEAQLQVLADALRG